MFEYLDILRAFAGDAGAESALGAYALVAGFGTSRALHRIARSVLG